MAEQLVENLSQPFDPSKYTDDYRANLMKIIRAKMKGKKIDVAEPEERESTQVVDLMARLQESLEMGKKRGEQRSAAQRATRAKRASRRKTRMTDDSRPCSPSVGTDVPAGGGWVFEPKYDGIRILGVRRRATASRSSAGTDSTRRTSFRRSSTR